MLFRRQRCKLWSRTRSRWSGLERGGLVAMSDGFKRWLCTRRGLGDSRMLHNLHHAGNQPVVAATGRRPDPQARRGTKLLAFALAARMHAATPPMPRAVALLALALALAPCSSRGRSRSCAFPDAVSWAHNATGPFPGLARSLTCAPGNVDARTSGGRCEPHMQASPPAVTS